VLRSPGNDNALKSSARVNMTSDLTSKGQTFTLTMVGAYDFGRQSGRLDVTLPGGAISHVSEIFTEDTIYAKLPPSEGSPGGWGSLARSRATAHYVLRSPGNDPGDVLRQARRVHWDGSGVADDLGGRQATKYVGAMDDETAVLYLSDEAKAKAQQMFQASESVSDGVLASAWVDDAGALVRLVFDWTVADPDTNGIRSTLALDLSQPGVRVTVTAPDAATSAADFQGILLG
jgi:hypothetical protein